MYGIKAQLLAKQSPELVRESISQTALDMLACGITAFVDFREGGFQGIEVAKKPFQNASSASCCYADPDMVYSETDVVSETDLPQAIIEETKKALAAVAASA